MKSFTLSAIALSIAITGFTGSANAQNFTEPAGLLFFEGDIVRHRLDGQVGPFCVLTNRFMRGEAIAWRIRALLPDGSVADDSVISNMVVTLGSGEEIPVDYGPHGNPPTDYFWANSWTIPDNFPTGSIGYSVTATLNDGRTVNWKPFERPNTQLAVIEGTPAMGPAAN